MKTNIILIKQFLDFLKYYIGYPKISSRVYIPPYEIIFNLGGV